MSLRTRLSALEASGLIRLAQVEPEIEYLFRHALVQDAAYASLLKADRRILHRTVGEALALFEAMNVLEYAGRVRERLASVT